MKELKISLEKESDEILKIMEDVRESFEHYNKNMQKALTCSIEGMYDYESYVENADSYADRTFEGLSKIKTCVKLLTEFGVISNSEEYYKEIKEIEYKINENESDMKRIIDYILQNDDISELIDLVGLKESKRFMHKHRNDTYKDFVSACTKVIKNTPVTYDDVAMTYNELVNSDIYNKFIVENDLYISHKPDRGDIFSHRRYYFYKNGTCEGAYAEFETLKDMLIYLVRKYR